MFVNTAGNGLTSVTAWSVAVKPSVRAVLVRTSRVSPSAVGNRIFRRSGVVDESGRVRKVKVCARYIKAGKFVKAPRGGRAKKAA